MRITLISNRHKGLFSYIAEVLRYRHVIMSFAKRNVMGKIAQTRLGVLIILVQSILLTIVLGFVIRRAIDFGIDYPYQLYLLPGMCGWYVFSYLVSLSSMSLIQHQGIISKVAFPRIILPLSFGVSVTVDLLAWILVNAAMLFFFEVVPGPELILLPVFMLMNIITGLAIGMWLAVLSVKNRDLVLISPLFIGFGVFLTPVFYPISILPDWLEKVLYFNPLAGVVEGYRCCFVTGSFDYNYIWGFIISLFLFVSCIYVFSRKEGRIADSL